MAALMLVAGVAATHAAAAQDTRAAIGVMPFDNGGSYGLESEDFAAFEIGLQQMLITELAVNAELRLVERSRLKGLMEEQDIGASGRVDANTAARIGQLIGARYMILGGFIDWYADFRIDARIVDVETGEIVKTQRARDDRANMYDIVVDLANSITRGLNLPPLSGQALNQRRERGVPEEAVRLYTKGLLYQDRGDTDRAADLFSQAATVFPAYTEAQEALRQIRG
jgi:curli biogenesis system outer membrane secretion channel CsgG